MQTLHILLLVYTFVIESFTVNINNTNHEQTNKSQITIASEGGSIFSNSSTAQLNSNSDLNLLNSFNDLYKSHKSSIVARKKAELTENITTSPINNKDVTNNTFDFIKANATNTNKITMPKKGNATNLENSSPKINHKPLILSYEALAQADEKNKVFISESGPSVKVHELNSNSHPGMVMPIVITILVVPMFAVVGYMALKRGREAWKNRHYKRMDFLLDGMYNE